MINYNITKKFFIIIISSLLLSAPFCSLAEETATAETGAESQDSPEVISSEEPKESLDFFLEKLSSQLAILEEIIPIIANCAIVDFNRNLEQGMSGRDVKCLQTILNLNEETRIAEEGTGSLGKETGDFDALTRKAVVVFQNLHREEVLSPLNLTQGTGFVGSRTRMKLNMILKNTLASRLDSLNSVIREIDSIKEKIIETKATVIEQEVAPEEIGFSASTPAPTPAPTPTPTPTQAPLSCQDQFASGKQTYSVTTKSVPRITQTAVDPLDVDFQSSQIVTAKINDPNNNAITSVSGLASTDSKTTSFSLTLISGIETNGTWQGTWTLEDSICENYMVIITAISDSGTSEVALTFR